MRGVGRTRRRIAERFPVGVRVTGRRGIEKESCRAFDRLKRLAQQGDRARGHPAQHALALPLVEVGKTLWAPRGQEAKAGAPKHSKQPPKLGVSFR